MKQAITLPVYMRQTPKYAQCEKESRHRENAVEYAVQSSSQELQSASFEHKTIYVGHGPYVTFLSLNELHLCFPIHGVPAMRDLFPDQRYELFWAIPIWTVDLRSGLRFITLTDEGFIPIGDFT